MPQPRPALPTSAQRGAVPAQPGASPDPARAAVRGGVLGNYVDQFDIFLPVIALAPVTATLYGPGDAVAHAGLVLVATLLARPVGAAVLGSWADRAGRTVVARTSLAGLAVATLLVALVPAALLGPTATLAVVVALRVVCGFFVGGGYTAGVPLAIEWTAPPRRGLVSGAIMAMSPAANATIAVLVLGLLTVLGEDGYAAWGWRVPFVVGAGLAVVALAHYSRHVQDAPAAARPAQADAAPGTAARGPLAEVLVGAQRHRLRRLFVMMTGLWLFTAMAVAVLTAQLGAVRELDPVHVTAVMLAGTAASAVTMLACGHLSTRVGRRRFFLGFGAASAVLAPAAYLAALGPATGAGLVLAVVALQVVTVSVYGPAGAWLVEQFPPGVRSSGYGTAYSLSIVLPSLYPFYLPPLQYVAGPVVPVAVLLALAGVLVLVGAAVAPPVVEQVPDVSPRRA